MKASVPFLTAHLLAGCALPIEQDANKVQVITAGQKERLCKSLGSQHRAASRPQRAGQGLTASNDV